MEKLLDILVVDDDDISLMLMSSLLKHHKCIKKLYKAKNGLDALGLLNQNPKIDLIFLDIQMPLMNGFECLSNMQNHPKLKHIPVIIMTTDETQQEQAFKLGAYEFITKPIRQQELFSKIDKIARYLSD